MVSANTLAGRVPLGTVFSLSGLVDTAEVSQPARGQT